MQTILANPTQLQAKTSLPRRRPLVSNCRHPMRCPDATAADFRAARVVAGQPSQGWSLLCNGVVLFDDGGALLPEGTALAPGAVRTVPGAELGSGRTSVRS